jgi:hypothetical protein
MKRYLAALALTSAIGGVSAQGAFGLKNVYLGDRLDVAELKARVPLLRDCMGDATTIGCWGKVPVGDSQALMTVFLRAGSVTYIEAELPTESFDEVVAALSDAYGPSQALPGSKSRVWASTNGTMLTYYDRHPDHAGMTLMAMGTSAAILEVAMSRAKNRQPLTDRRPSNILK